MNLSRLTLEKFKKALPLLLRSGVFQLVGYYLPVFIPMFRPFTDMTTAWDRALPFLNVFIIPYVLAYVTWVVYWLFLAGEGEPMLTDYVRAEIIGKLVALAFFLFLPTTMTRAADTGSGFCGWLTAFIYAADEPVMRLFPSLHCFYAWIWARAVLDSKNTAKWERIVSVVCCVVICASTVFVRQHVLWDIPGGVALAELSVRVSKYITRRKNK